MAHGACVPDMERMIAEFYELAGLDEDGKVPPDKRGKT